jgi:DNA-binding Lrp family transcriptional regulator
MALLRFMQDYGHRRLPIGFVAYQLGLEEEVVRKRIDALAEQHVLKTEGTSVSMAYTRQSNH